MDLFLIQRSSFFIGTQSGPMDTAYMFNKPVLITNMVQVMECLPKMKNEAEVNAESDKAKRDEIDTRNSSEQLIYQTEKQIDELKRQYTVQNIFYGIKNPDIEPDDHSSRFNAFQDFIDSLRKESDITIDSMIVKSFILEKRMHI